LTTKNFLILIFPQKVLVYKFNTIKKTPDLHNLLIDDLIMHAFFKRALYQLSEYITIKIQLQNARCKSTPDIVCSRLVLAKNVNPSRPNLTLNNFHLDCCTLKGKGCNEFLLYTPNVFTISNPMSMSSNVDNWSVHILHGMGEIVSICSSYSDVQVTYKVATVFPVPDAIYISIHYNGISVFPSPVKIFQEFLPNLNFTLCTIPFVRGNYAYCLVDGKICAYE
jgi:hypothetical protein